MSATFTFNGMLNGLGLFFFMAKELCSVSRLGVSVTQQNMFGYGANVKLMLKFFLKKSKN
jgi:hypothetical protein